MSYPAGLWSGSTAWLVQLEKRYLRTVLRMDSLVSPAREVVYEDCVEDGQSDWLVQLEKWYMRTVVRMDSLVGPAREVVYEVCGEDGQSGWSS
ncbi:hypothetical protein PoB_005766000 [Plakobranchus ocellatus]|uniref:Uncharacterized protein n=1 Tax=Plakobranchus ocellatus TaxID=259542 RepID=A0AAV4CHX5_9GAST|nr:hypothetical protein PoB_005766000 [Plakobranchus ocellatus]